MAKAYLHIGTPKTGTTSLQRFLSANSRLLEESGFLFPKFGFSYPNVSSYRNGYFISRTDASPFVEQREESYRRLAELARDGRDIILTDEAIWMRQRKRGFWKAIGKRFREMGLELHIVVYLRRQDALVESYWNQRVKGNRLTESFDEFMQGAFRTMPLHYDNRLSVIRDEGKPESIIVRVFERDQMVNGSTIDDFCRIIGFVRIEDCVVPASDANTSFPMDVAEVKRLINRNASYEGMDKFFTQAIADTYTPEDAVAARNLSLLTMAERKELLQEFEEGNAYVAREFLNRQDGRLFYEPIRESKKWSPEPKELFPALVRVLSGTDILLYKRIMELEQKVASLSEALEAANRDDVTYSFKKRFGRKWLFQGKDRR